MGGTSGSSSKLPPPFFMCSKAAFAEIFSTGMGSAAKVKRQR